MKNRDRNLDNIIHRLVMHKKPEVVYIATRDNGQSAAAIQTKDGPFFTKQDIENWIEETGRAQGYKLDKWHITKPYSSDIDYAWQVVEKLFKDGYAIQMKCSEYLGKIKGEEAGGCDVTFTCKAGARGRFHSWAETFPMAICLAAKKVVEAFPIEE